MDKSYKIVIYQSLLKRDDEFEDVLHTLTNMGVMHAVEVLKHDK